MIKLACSLELASQNANTYMGADISVQHESGDLGASMHDSACNKFVKPMVCHVDNHAHSIASTSAKFGQLVNEAPADYANYMQKALAVPRKIVGIVDMDITQDRCAQLEKRSATNVTPKATLPKYAESQEITCTCPIKVSVVISIHANPV